VLGIRLMQLRGHGAYSFRIVDGDFEFNVAVVDAPKAFRHFRRWLTAAVAIHPDIVLEPLLCTTKVSFSTHPPNSRATSDWDRLQFASVREDLPVHGVALVENDEFVRQLDIFPHHGSGVHFDDALR